MSSRIYLANVGVNASHGFAGPVFLDRTFEFLPIPENPNISGPHAVRYRDLQSYNNRRSDLSLYVPRKMWDRATHNDPEFDTFTYGDNCSTSPRASALRKVRQGDTLLFLSRLVRWEENEAIGPYGFYLVGHLKIGDVLCSIRDAPEQEVLVEYGANAHIKRGLSSPGLWDGFWVFKGTEKSRRYEKAVPVTRNFCDEVFEDAKGFSWKWDLGRTELQTIGSYTRTCRCVIDPEVPRGASRAKALWQWIELYSERDTNQ